MAHNEVEARTPRSEYATQITQAQKQALMDDLQLEITERARKLRAQYTLQAQDLRSRLERRVARIPTALRDRKMQDLIDEHAEKDKPKPAPPVAVKQPAALQAATKPEQPQKRGVKRPSDQISDHEDKENALPAPSQQPSSNPKKRTKITTTTTAPSTTTTAANSKAPRAASRKIVPSAVLSPRSHNSRTLPRSPVKPLEKPSIMSRPTSPIKPAATAAAPTKAPSRAPSRQTKRTATAPTTNTTMSGQENLARSSDASNTSAGTTIIKRGAGTAAAAPRTRATAGKRTVAAAAAAATTMTKAAAARKTATATAAAQKKENVAPLASTTAGGRTLRKRN